ncbi:putative MFS-type transporter YceJ [Sphaerisporangium melleum]|uniref:MFS-type transporter YceJ n=1 Tax=Sphaerisporangium melleum TaxID=321316 RepID=A0A917VN49_9ACTN|nr:putative MFS-type transporter YceJ [Sphaerisporangium melleum]GII73654.1 putative MFS-type transporter YceJ [Sphaerisporangium melleum]
MIAWMSFATMFVIGTDTFLVAPMLPTLAATFDVSTGVSGWMVSAYALGFALFGLIVGPFSDGRDRRTVLLTGFAGFAIATALCGVAQNFWMMIAFRLLAGVFAAFVTPQIWASIPVLVKPDQVVRTMGFAGAGMSVSQVVGVPLGGWLAAVSWHTPFWCIGGLSALAWLVLFRVFPSVPGTRAAGNGFFSIYSDLFSSATFRLYILAYLVYQTGVFEAFSFIGTWLSRDFGLGVAAIGACVAALGLAMALTSIFGSHVIRRLGERRTLAIGIIGLIIAYGATPFAPNVAVAVGLLALGSAFLGINYPLLMSGLIAHTTAARGTVSSLATTALYAGTTIGGLVGGVLLVRFDGFLGVAGFSVVTLVLALTLYALAGAFRAPKAERAPAPTAA